MVSLIDACKIVISQFPNKYIHVVNEHETVYAFVLIDKGVKMTGQYGIVLFTIVSKASGAVEEGYLGIEDELQGDYKQYTAEDLERRYNITMDNKVVIVPNPVIDIEEIKMIDDLKKRYDKLMEPNVIIKAGTKALEYVPDKVKNVGKNTGKAISQQDLIKQALEYAASGFKILEETAAKITIKENTIIKKLNKERSSDDITRLEEVCLARSYEIAKLVNSYRTSNVLVATVEGASTGALGFVGLVPNFVLSTFLYFRAVQSVAMFYGYDVKNSETEMEIASAVFMSALNPKQDAVNNELTAMVGKFMVFTETTAVRQLSNKTWSAMIEHGGLGLMIAQIRALANKAAQSALQKAGKKGLEQSVLKGILEQLGKQLTLKSSGRAMPVLGGVFGAFFDTAQMHKIINYADIFYSKRFLEEKEARIKAMVHPEQGINSIIIDNEEAGESSMKEIDIVTAYEIVKENNEGHAPDFCVEYANYYGFNYKKIANSAILLVYKISGEYKTAHFTETIEWEILKRYEEKDLDEILADK